MAKALKLVVSDDRTPEERQEESLAELLQVVAEHKDDLVSLLKLVDMLEESGTLAVLTGLLGRGSKVGEILLHQVAKPSSTNTLNNLMALGGLVGELEPAVTRRLVAGVGAGMERATAALDRDEQVGLLGLIRALRDPDVNRVLTFGVNFLKGMGERL
jgi:uncharacterized protein YjgD (DUF1641 family)